MGQEKIKNKKIILFFIFMLILFFFIYKIFISDGTQYEILLENYINKYSVSSGKQQYSGKLLKVQKSQKNKRESKNIKKIPSEFEEMENILMEIKSLVKTSRIYKEETIKQVNDLIIQNDVNKSNIFLNSKYKSLNITIKNDNEIEKMVNMLNEKIKKLRLIF